MEYNMMANTEAWFQAVPQFHQNWSRLSADGAALRMKRRGTQLNPLAPEYIPRVMQPKGAMARGNKVIIFITSNSSCDYQQSAERLKEEEMPKVYSNTQARANKLPAFPPHSQDKMSALKEEAMDTVLDMLRTGNEWGRPILRVLYGIGVSDIANKFEIPKI